MVIRFGPFTLDSQSGDLAGGGTTVRLRPQPAAVLVYLLQRRGRLVARDELRLHLWGRDTYVHFDHGLNSCIKQIRQALASVPSARRYLETVPRRGYRFAGPPDEAAVDDRRWRLVVPCFDSYGGERAGVVARSVREATLAHLVHLAPPGAVVYDAHGLCRHCGGAPHGPETGLAQDVRAGFALLVAVAGDLDVTLTARLIDVRTGVHLWASAIDLGRDLQAHRRAGVAGRIAEGVARALDEAFDSVTAIRTDDAGRGPDMFARSAAVPRMRALPRVRPAR